MNSNARPLLSDSMYNKLKWVALVLLPALGAFYFGVAQIWGLPKAEEVVGTITVVDTFLGVLLGLSTKSYNTSDKKYDGEIVVEQYASGRKVFTIAVEGDPEETLEHLDEALFRIRR